MPEVVFVDDDPAILEVVGDLTKGWNIEVFDNPREALKASKKAFRLVSDLSMPEMNGLQVIYEARKENPNLQAFLYTLAAEKIKNERPELLKQAGIAPYQVYDKTQINELFGEVFGLHEDVLEKVPYLFPEDADDFVTKLEKAGNEVRKIKIPFKLIELIPKKEGIKYMVLLLKNIYADNKEYNWSIKGAFEGKEIEDAQITGKYSDAIALSYRHSPHVLTLVHDEVGDYMRSARGSADHGLGHIIL
ncbi:MAG: response regulator [Candidatus Aenigmarchaeota archaeon]|nr:response regulator [Candidatus Aenigmarchaeota archaeon]